MDAKGSFGEVLKKLRNQERLSRRELAQQLQVHPNSIYKWERGDVLPDQARVTELIRALELSEEKKLLLLEAHSGHRILPSLHNLPAVQNPYFTGREAIFKQLHDQLAPGKQVALTQAISGLGGIGKTQVALHYAYRFRNVYSHVLWITADSPEMFMTELIRLACDLDLLEKNEKDQNKILRAMQRWLREYLDWLLILDNIEELNLVSSFIPAGHLGSVLLTTRRQVTEPVAQAIPLDVLSDDEGILFLLKRAKRLTLDESLDQASAEEVVIAGAITRQLGGLPLALDQAGAYIAETGGSLSGYLDLLKQAEPVLLQRRGTNPTNHPLSVTKTFSLAFKQIQQKNKIAIELLKVCAYLAPDAIPLELITQGVAYLGPILESVATNILQYDHALETLQAYSLVRRDAESNTLSIHRLVQVVLRERLDQQSSQQWAEHVVRATNAIFPDVEHASWLQCERLLSHALVCAELIEVYQINHLEAARLLDQTGYYLYERACYQEAKRLKLHVIAIHKQQLGAGHPSTAASMDKLATIHLKLGEYQQAELLYQQALIIYEQQQEAEHLLRAQTLNNLAVLYLIQHKYEQAEAYCQQALFIHEQQLGPEDPKTAQNLYNLAALFHAQSKYDYAEPLYKRALAIRERYLGSEHPDTTESLNGLGGLYTHQGRYDEAQPLYERALVIRKQHLGYEHPDTAQIWWWLATLARRQDKLDEAKSLYEQALHVFEQQLGPEHPRTQALREQYKDMCKID